LFDDVSIADFKSVMQLLPMSSSVGLDWDALYALDTSGELKRRTCTPEDQARLEHKLTEFFSQLMTFDG
jgi:hypothetical protein